VTVLTVEAEVRLFEPSEVTLEDQILGAWEGLTAHGRADCPVCHGELETSGCGSPARPDAPAETGLNGSQGRPSGYPP
jgi:hypothetical protein